MALLKQSRMMLLHYSYTSVRRIIHTSASVELTRAQTVIIIIKLLLFFRPAWGFEALFSGTSWSHCRSHKAFLFRLNVVVSTWSWIEGATSHWSLQFIFDVPYFTFQILISPLKIITLLGSISIHTTRLRGVTWILESLRGIINYRLVRETI